MAAAFSFDINAVPATIILPANQLAWRRVPVYVMGEPTLYNYILLVEFKDDLGFQRTLEMRLYTDTIAVRTYELANQGTLSDAVDIALCNSMYFRMLKDSTSYNSEDLAQIDVTALSSVPDCDGTFTGDMLMYTAMPVLNTSLPMISLPAVADTISITNGVFTNIAIL